MEYNVPKSICLLCKSEFTAKGMGRHITACLKNHTPKKKETLAKSYCYLSVRATYNNDYFLFLLVSQNSTLGDLDDFLRKIWLECCGHMSSFSYGKRNEEIPMSIKIKQICDIGGPLTYVYDFGDSTKLDVNVFKEITTSIKISSDIILLSRNAQPLVPCDECGNYPAIHICTECQWDDSGWLCEKCAPNHECDDEMFLPVVNSPRTGVCGYSGQEEKE